MAAIPKLELLRVCTDSRSISAVANTITLSFASDPLIEWLRPHATPWARNQPDTHKWQCRRVQRATLEGVVLQSASTSQIAKRFPAKSSPSKQEDKTSTETNSNDASADKETETDADADADAGSVVILHPPASHLSWTLRRILLACKLRLLDFFSPVDEKGTNEKRYEQMMSTHNEVLARTRQQRQLSELWYLEVIAVHPSLQARGLGKKVMHEILNHTNNEPIILECTRESNVAFYNSFGFEIVEEVELADGEGSAKLWFMVRKGKTDK